MTSELTVKTTTTGTMVILGNWELRAGSQDTEEWLARGGQYPGDAAGTMVAFGASQSDAATGYDPAPKMALLRVTLAGQLSSHVITGTGLNSILFTGASQRGTKTAGDALDTLSVLTGAVSAPDSTTGKRDCLIELVSEGGEAASSVDLMVMYN